MIRAFIYIMIILNLASCEDVKETTSIDSVNWQKRKIKESPADSLENGTTYLSIYSHIYSQSEQTTHDLTATVSMRNTNLEDTIYIDNAKYYNTRGDLIRTYFNETIYLFPMETVEIIINQVDKEGGSGANFLFDWQIPANCREPLFEGVMISTYGQQGLSFTTSGVRVK